MTAAARGGVGLRERTAAQGKHKVSERYLPLLHEVMLTSVANPGPPFWDPLPPLVKPTYPSQKTELFVKELPPAPPTAGNVAGPSYHQKQPPPPP